MLLIRLVMVCGLVLALAACATVKSTTQPPPASPTPAPSATNPTPDAGDTLEPTLSPSAAGEIPVPTASPALVGETPVPTASPSPTTVETLAPIASPSPSAGEIPTSTPLSLETTTPTMPPSPPVVETPVATPTSVVRLPSGGTQGRGFVPLDNPAFISANEASFLGDEELVLGYASQDEARAYPIRMMRFHHIANDTVRSGPLLVTY